MIIEYTPVELEIDGGAEIALSVEDCDGVKLDVAMEVVNEKSDHPYYDGEYDVVPSFDTQKLETEGKVMRDDVTVEPITVSRTTNPAGGNTVYIGGIIING